MCDKKISLNSEVENAVSPSTSGNASCQTSANITNTENSGKIQETDIINIMHECPICLQTCIHPARLPCDHIFCFLCIKGVAYKNRKCAMCRQEIPMNYLEHPQLINEPVNIAKAIENGYQWFYEGRNGWWQYDVRTSQDIEDAFERGEKSCSILVAGFVYIVDLQLMMQQRQNEPSRCRRVKRDLSTIPKKGIAGLRIDERMVAADLNDSSHAVQECFLENTSPDLNQLRNINEEYHQDIRGDSHSPTIDNSTIDLTVTHENNRDHSNISNAGENHLMEPELQTLSLLRFT